MKLNRRITILVVLMLIALFAAVVPAFADTYNDVASFERDLNHDGEPDFWDLHGNVTWVCFEKELWDGYCGVVFGPSAKRAIVYIGATEEAGFTTNEEGLPNAFGALAGARDLDSNRIYLGEMIVLDDGSVFRAYGPFPGGDYKGEVWINAVLDLNGEGLPEWPYYGPMEGTVVAQYAGIVALPGQGYLLVDAIDD